MLEYRNPVLTGMYPDPSVCRVGEDYYLVTSTFEYLPGIPVFHSRDLVHWEQIGHAIHRPEQLSLHGVKTRGGLYAPTIREHEGTFYVVCTLAEGQGGNYRNFFVSAADPRGPWSMPIVVEQSGIDPSLFFAGDGTVYLTSNLFGEGYSRPVIQKSVMDIKSGKLLTKPRVIAAGSGGAATEAPHLYFMHGKYYLLCAEGGTALGHMVTVFRADNPWGPFDEACPHNPILTARDDIASAPLLATGHADLITTQHGETWMVFLCYRHATNKHHHLGRETALLPVTWDDHGWPRVVGGKVAAEYVNCQNTQLTGTPFDDAPVTDTFTADTLNLCWNSVRCFPAQVSRKPESGGLSLHGEAGTLSDDQCAFIGQRQRHFDCQIETRVSFRAHGSNEEAGIALRQCDTAYYAWVLTSRAGQPAIVLKRTVGDMHTESGGYPVDGEQPVTLMVKADREQYHFGIAVGDGVRWLETASTRLLSTEVNGGFTGVYIGMYATGNGLDCRKPAIFHSFTCRKA